MPSQPKRLEFAVELDEGGPMRAGDAALESPPGWSAEHLVLAGLARCSLTSLRYHARRADIDATGSGAVRGVVTKREADGRYAFVEIDLRLDVRLTPQPDDQALAELLAKAERDCFVGASLTSPPRYTWRVGGRDVASS